AAGVGQHSTALEHIHIDLGQSDHEDKGDDNSSTLPLHFHQIFTAGAVQYHQTINSQAEKEKHQRQVDTQGMQYSATVTGEAIKITAQLTTCGTGGHDASRCQ